MKPIGYGLHISMTDLKGGSHRFEASDVHIDGSGTKVVPSGQGQTHSSIPCQKRTKHIDGCADPFNKFVRGDRCDLTGICKHQRPGGG